MTECDLPDPVSKDPGLGPPITTERQRLYLAQIGPQQPKLFNYPQNEDITSSNKLNKIVSRLFGFPSIPFWNTVLNRMQLFVMSAKCSQLV